MRQHLEAFCDAALSLLNSGQHCWSCSWHASELIPWRFPCIWYRMPALRWCFTFSWLQPACSEMPACLLLAPVCSSGSAMLFPAWRGISLCFSGIQWQLSCPESLCLESLFPHHLSSHTCLFSSSSSSPRLSLSFFFVMLNFKSSLGLEAEAKVVKGGRERIYSFNYRDTLSKKKGNIYHCSSPAISAWQRWFSSFSQRQIFQGFNSKFHMPFRICDCTECAGVFLLERLCSLQQFLLWLKFIALRQL